MRRAACFHASRASELCYGYEARSGPRLDYEDTLRGEEGGERIRLGDAFGVLRDTLEMENREGCDAEDARREAEKRLVRVCRQKVIVE